MTSQTVILHSIPHTIAIRGHRGKPSHQDCIGGEGAGGEDDVVQVGVGGVFKEGRGHHPLLLRQVFEGKEVSVESLSCCHDDKYKCLITMYINSMQEHDWYTLALNSTFTYMYYSKHHVYFVMYSVRFVINLKTLIKCHHWLSIKLLGSF